MKGKLHSEGMKLEKPQSSVAVIVDTTVFSASIELGCCCCYWRCCHGVDAATAMVLIISATPEALNAWRSRRNKSDSEVKQPSCFSSVFLLLYAAVNVSTQQQQRACVRACECVCVCNLTLRHTL